MHGEANEQLALYALGALDPAERAACDQHLALGCAECERELLDLDRTVGVIAHAADPVAPPPELKGRLLAAIGSLERAPGLRVVDGPNARSKPAAPRPFGAAFGIATLLAAAAFAIVFMAWALVSSGNKLDDAVRQLADARAGERASQAEADRQRQLLSLVADPAARATELRSTSGESAAGMNVVWHPGQKRGVLVARGMPQVASGKTYELWLVAGDTPLPAAVFNTDASGNALVEIDTISEAGPPKVFAVTVEPAGGSKLPTSKIIMAGEYSGV